MLRFVGNSGRRKYSSDGSDELADRHDIRIVLFFAIVDEECAIMKRVERNIASMRIHDCYAEISEILISALFSQFQV